MAKRRSRSKWCRHRFQMRGRLHHLAGYYADQDFPMEQPIQIHLKCLLTCQKCHAACLQRAGSCLLSSDDPLFSPRVRLLLETAAICGMTAQFIRRDSQFAARMGALCAQLCQTSAKAFEGVDEWDECAALCLKCVGLCGQMSLLAPQAWAEFHPQPNGNPQL